jgi:hypothetical protein
MAMNFNLFPQGNAWTMKGEGVRKLYKRAIILICLLVASIITSDSHAEALMGKVTSIHGDFIELNLGSEKGIKSGDSGRVYYTITVAEKEKPIFIAKFKVTHLSEKSSMAQIEEMTGEVQVGYWVEVIVKAGELEVKSEPSGAKVYVDGKQVGETPLVLSDIKMGRHLIRVTKEGYDSYEVLEQIGTGRKKVIANLKKAVREGELMVLTEPSGAAVYLNGRPVGTSPYEGKGLSSGKYSVRVTKEGYETWEKTEIVEGGKKVEVLALLKMRGGNLVVTAKPSGANIYIDGKFVGMNSYENKTLPPRSYKVNVNKEGYETWEGDVAVKAGERAELSVDLKVKRGELLIRTEPSGATIYTGGKLVGTSSYEGKELSPGSYRVKVIKEGYEPWEKDVVVEVGKRVEVSVQLKVKSAKEIQERCNAPGWNVGDKWTYKSARGGLGIRQVLDIKEDLFIIKMSESQNLRAYDKKTMNLKFLVEKSGKQVLASNSFRKVLDFPIFVGKKWKDTVPGIRTATKREVAFENEFQIEGVEEVTTPAGTFKAFKIYQKQTIMTPPVSNGWARYWYSPIAKNIVKTEVEKSSYWAGVTWPQDTELISYELK